MDAVKIRDTAVTIAKTAEKMNVREWICAVQMAVAAVVAQMYHRSQWDDVANRLASGVKVLFDEKKGKHVGTSRSAFPPPQ